MLVGDAAAVGTAVVLLGGLVRTVRRQPDLSVRVTADALEIRLARWEALWAQRRRLRIPLTQITDVDVVRFDQLPFTGVPFRGTVLPGLLHVGSVRVDGRREFWVCRRRGAVLRIDCAAGAHTRVLLQLAQPGQIAQQIRLALL
jgi:hypothetical protein